MLRDNCKQFDLFHAGARSSSSTKDPIADRADAIVKFLHFNGVYKDEAASAEVFKVLVIDAYTLNIVATLLHTEALRQHGVTLVLSIEKDREAITDAPVVYFVRASSDNADAIVHDLEHGLYREVCRSVCTCAGACPQAYAAEQLCTVSAAAAVAKGAMRRKAQIASAMCSAHTLKVPLCAPAPRAHAYAPRHKVSGLQAHVNFAAWAPRPILEALAAGTVKAATTCTIAKVFDQHLNFIALESNLFTLSLPDSYVQLNDNTASESAVSAAVSDVAEGLFGVCATLGTVPIIRCAAGGLAEAVARALSGKIAGHLKGRSAGLFAETGLGLGGGGGRPLLCLFDRNFDLTPMVEQPFMYKALVHDCLGLHLNKAQLPQVCVCVHICHVCAPAACASASRLHENLRRSRYKCAGVMHVSHLLRVHDCLWLMLSKVQLLRMCAFNLLDGAHLRAFNVATAAHGLHSSCCSVL